MKKITELLMACGLALLALSPVRAQETHRKKVAVVLSGGGAKGMAHIGVLKVIERAGIPVDIVTGTSMGSIVGGLYCCGWNADALDSIVRKQNWLFLLSDQKDYYSQTLANRKKQSTYVLSKTYTAHQPKLSEMGGAVAGKNLSKLFNRLTYGYTDSMDFNKLPIPFACVATNIIDNTEHDFHSGVLAQAMRTSMSIPGVFAPVKMGDEVLVDGGLRNNYPADLAREMGADYIIGATVQGPPKTAEDLTTASSVIGQIVDINCKNKYNDNLAITDIPIRVNTQGYSAASFTQAAIDTLIRRGEEEAMKHWDELMALKRKLGLPDDYRPEPVPYKPEAREPLDFSVENAYARPEHDQLQGSLGLRFDTEEMVAAQINGVYRSAKRPADVSLTLRLGKRLMAQAMGAWTLHAHQQLALAYTFRHNDINIYEGGEKDFNVTYNQHNMSLGFLGINIKNLTMDLSTQWDYYHYNKLLMSGDFSQEPPHLNDEHFFSYHARLHYDSENMAIFPSRGAKLLMEYAYVTDNFAEYNGHAGFSEASGLWRMSFALTKHLVLQPTLYGRMLFGSEIPLSRQTVIGGPWFAHYTNEQIPFVGVHHVELTDRHFLAGQVKLQEQLTTNNFVLLKIAVAQSASELDDILDTGTHWGGQLAYYYNTVLGPLGATLGYSNITKEVDFYINLGFVF